MGKREIVVGEIIHQVFAETARFSAETTGVHVQDLGRFGGARRRLREVPMPSTI